MLKPGGYYVMWAPTQRAAETFGEVFSHVVHVRPASVLIGSVTPIAFDSDALAARLSDRPISDYLQDAGADLTTLRANFSGQTGRWSPADRRLGSDINTDLFPRDEFYLNNRISGAH